MQRFTISFIYLFFICLSVFVSCFEEKDRLLKEGEELARISCASCHLFTEPDLLDKESWTTVLPKMAEFMNVEAYFNPFEKTEERIDSPETRMAPQNLFPHEKWEKIYNYYLKSAPEKPLPVKQVLQPVKEQLPDFNIHTISGKYKNPLTTYVQIDTINGGFYFGDGKSGIIYKYNKLLECVDSIFGETGIVAADRDKSGTCILSMGILTPSDKKLGKYIFRDSKNSKSRVILDSLNRPVHVTTADLNNDKREDLIICEFGFRSGTLSWFENTGDYSYRKHILRQLPGPISTAVYDFDHNGLPDIMALMAQGDEGLFIYYNEGGNRFREESVIRFPPVYGVNYFALFDYDGDGDMDILTTNGDNADYSFSLKAYHGIRIFLNDGRNRFEEKIFLPVNGIQKAIPADFDQDGFTDLVSISYYPDYEKGAAESFIFWKNNRRGGYDRFTFPASFRGRWMVMDVGDFDRDGDIDLVLGNVNFPFGHVPGYYKGVWAKEKISVLILVNRSVY